MKNPAYTFARLYQLIEVRGGLLRLFDVGGLDARRVTGAGQALVPFLCAAGPDFAVFEGELLLGKVGPLRVISMRPQERWVMRVGVVIYSCFDCLPI